MKRLIHFFRLMPSLWRMTKTKDIAVIYPCGSTYYQRQYINRAIRQVMERDNEIQKDFAWPDLSGFHIGSNGDSNPSTK